MDNIKNIQYICALLALSSSADAMNTDMGVRETNIVTSMAVDTDRDGTIDELVTDVPQKGGLLIKDIVEYRGGVQFRILTRTYNRKGEKLREVQDWDCDGKPDIIWTQTVPKHKLPSPAHYTAEEKKARILGLRANVDWIQRRLKLLRSELSRVYK